MSAVLRAAGRDFDVDAFLADCTFPVREEFAAFLRDNLCHQRMCLREKQLASTRGKEASLSGVRRL